MGLSDMDHMVAEAVTSEQAIGGLELGHDLRDLATKNSSWLTPGNHCLDLRNLVAGESVLVDVGVIVSF